MLPAAFVFFILAMAAALQGVRGAASSSGLLTAVALIFLIVALFSGGGPTAGVP
jgi:hypothetical protein